MVLNASEYAQAVSVGKTRIRASLGLAALRCLPIADTTEARTQQMRAMIAHWTDMIEKLKSNVE